MNFISPCHIVELYLYQTVRGHAAEGITVHYYRGENLRSDLSALHPNVKTCWGIDCFVSEP
jgi:hypothetical protein